MMDERRLIDADALGIGRINPLVFDKPEYAHGWNCAVEIVQNAPEDCCVFFMPVKEDTK